MPSFKATLASLALFAFAFNPVAASAAAGSHDIESASLFARRENRMETATRLRAARSRAARKTKRESNVEKRAAVDVSKMSKAFAALSSTRCNRDAACIQAAATANLTTNGELACYQRFCTVTCEQGYRLTSKGKCKKSNSACPAPPAYGAYRLTAAGQCKLVCFKSLGYTVSAGSCVSLTSDANNCGYRGNTCSQSYNGIGTAVCSGGACTLRCPSETRAALVQAPSGYSCV